jgi:urease accessory protein
MSLSGFSRSCYSIGNVGRVVLDRRDVGSVGRTARLELVFACRAGRTILSHAYAEPPFRVGRYFSEDTGVHMILAASAPGIFGGDDFEQHISVERGARVRLTSQSALQVHPACASEREVKKDARLRCRYDVESGASLSCNWDPMIPFAAARIDLQTSVTLASDAALFWSDAFMAGREGHGERWAFERLAHELRIARGSDLEYLERYQLTGADNPRQRWAAGDACYFGTIVSSGAAASGSSAERLHETLAGAGIPSAVDVLGSRLMLLRLMSSDGARFHHARALARDALTVSPSRPAERIIGTPKGEAV